MQLVERAELLADLDAWLAEARRGSGSMLLGGEAGVGARIVRPQRTWPGQSTMPSRRPPACTGAMRPDAIAAPSGGSRL